MDCRRSKSGKDFSGLDKIPINVQIWRFCPYLVYSGSGLRVLAMAILSMKPAGVGAELAFSHYEQTNHRLRLYTSGAMSVVGVCERIES